MSLCRLLRSTRRYSSSTSIPFPNPISTNTPPQYYHSSNNHYNHHHQRASIYYQYMHSLHTNPDKSRRLPDSTTALAGPRLQLHARVQSLLHAGDLDSASRLARQSVFEDIRPTVFTCNLTIGAMYRAKRYHDAKALFDYFFRQHDIVPDLVSYNYLIVSHCEANGMEEALKLYDDIRENAPYGPSALTYRHLKEGLADAGRVNDAEDLLHEMLDEVLSADSLVFDNVIRAGDLDKANELFYELVLNNVVLGFLDSGNLYKGGGCI